MCVCVCVAELCSFLPKAGCVWVSITAASRGSPFARAAGWHCGRWETPASCHPAKWHEPDTPDPLLNQNLVSLAQKNRVVVTEVTFHDCITDHLIITCSQSQKSSMTRYWFMFYMILIQISGLFCFLIISDFILTHFSFSSRVIRSTESWAEVYNVLKWLNLITTDVELITWVSWILLKCVYSVVVVCVCVCIYTYSSVWYYHKFGLIKTFYWSSVRLFMNPDSVHKHDNQHHIYFTLNPDQDELRSEPELQCLCYSRKYWFLSRTFFFLE